MLERLALLRPREQFRFDAEEFLIRGANRTVINLGNIYTDYCQAPRRERDALLDIFLQSMNPADLPGTLAEARASLLPVLRSIYGLESLQISAGNYAPKQSGEPGSSDSGEDSLNSAFARFGTLPFIGELGVAIAYDTEFSVQQVPAEHLEKWGVSLEEALAIALDNLRHKSAPRFAQIFPGCHASQYEDFYDAARLLLPEVAWSLGVAGNPVAMVPNRSCLLIAGDRDERAIAAMLAAAQQILQEQSRPLSAAMFRLEDRQWQPYSPPTFLEVPHGNLLRSMTAGDYSAQQQALRSDLERRQIDVFVASYSLVQPQGEEAGPLQSYAVVAEDVDTWVPRTDLLFFRSEARNILLLLPWSVVMAKLGHLFVPLPFTLARYRVTGFPSPEDLAELRAHALPLRSGSSPVPGSA